MGQVRKSVCIKPGLRVFPGISPIYRLGYWFIRRIVLLDTQIHKYAIANENSTLV